VDDWSRRALASASASRIDPWIHPGISDRSPDSSDAADVRRRKLRC
jgi:hypothetical protein